MASKGYVPNLTLFSAWGAVMIALITIIMIVHGGGIASDWRGQEGFLGTGASRMADFTVLAYVLLLVPAMIAGFVFARNKQFVPYHQVVMTAIVILNWGLISFIMANSFRGIGSDIPDNVNDTFYALPGIHFIFGITAQLIGTYLVIRMWFEDALPAALKVRKIKPLMRLTLACWLIAATLGVLTYVTWYEPFGSEDGDTNISPMATAEVTDEPTEVINPEAITEVTTPIATEESADSVAPIVTEESVDGVTPIATEAVSGSIQAATPIATEEVAQAVTPIPTEEAVALITTEEVSEITLATDTAVIESSLLATEEAVSESALLVTEEPATLVTQEVAQVASPIATEPVIVATAIPPVATEELLAATPVPPLATEEAIVSPAAVFLDIQFGSRELQQLNVHLPAGVQPFPTVLILHGGTGTRTQFDHIAQHLNQMGFAAVQPALDRGSFVDDGFCALAWIVANAPVFGFDTSRLFVMGWSQGGGIASLMMAADDTDQMTFNCPLPISDVPLAGAILLAPSYLGNRADPWGAVAEPAVWMDSNDPPVLIIHGQNDGNVAYQRSETLLTRLTEAGVSAQLVPLPSADHFFPLAITNTGYNDAMTLIDAFLILHASAVPSPLATEDAGFAPLATPEFTPEFDDDDDDGDNDHSGRNGGDDDGDDGDRDDDDDDDGDNDHSGRNGGGDDGDRDDD